MRSLIAAILSSVLPLVAGCGDGAQVGSDSLSDLFDEASSEASATDPEGVWSAALVAREFAFPADHAAHPDYRIEWWYYTGNLETDAGRRFGYQLTFFRTGIHRQPENPSRWAVRDLYTAHFAVSDMASGRHCFRERNNRRGVGLADAAADRYEVFNGDWKAWLVGDSHRLRAATAEFAIDLTLTPAKPLVLHGESGLSQKGPSPGNASYYYSYTRMATSGTVEFEGDALEVSGESWMDHEFSTSFLEAGQVGWDWFAIQLEDGTDLMLYRMRKTDGTADPHSSGSLVDPDGNVTYLSLADVEMQSLSTWTSAESGGEYPLRWRVTIPTHKLRLDVEPAFDAQEMRTGATTGITYWEGAINVTGAMGEYPVAGRGYMELTGYATPLSGGSLGGE